MANYDKLIDLNLLSKFANGVKSLLSNKADLDDLPTPRVEMTESTATLQPNTLYVWTTPMDTLSIQTASVDSSVVEEYHFIFTSPSTKATTLTLPTGVRVQDGFEILAGVTYEISIMDGLAAYGEWIQP